MKIIKTYSHNQQMMSVTGAQCRHFLNQKLVRCWKINLDQNNYIWPKHFKFYHQSIETIIFHSTHWYLNK